MSCDFIPKRTQSDDEDKGEELENVKKDTKRY